jgi:integrase/recombinase XerD
MEKRTGPHEKALQIVKYFRHENPDYNYLRSVFCHLRKKLDVLVSCDLESQAYRWFLVDHHRSPQVSMA